MLRGSSQGSRGNPQWLTTCPPNLIGKPAANPAKNPYPPHPTYLHPDWLCAQSFLCIDPMGGGRLNRHLRASNLWPAEKFSCPHPCPQSGLIQAPESFPAVGQVEIHPVTVPHSATLARAAELPETLEGAGNLPGEKRPRDSRALCGSNPPPPNSEAVAAPACLPPPRGLFHSQGRLLG